MRKAHRKQTLMMWCMLAGLAASPLTTQPALSEDPAGGDLSSLSLEQLTKMEVSSVARRDQQLYKTPAAVFVITQDDIRRSGATNVPEILRIVPGVQVAQVEANKWAVSARGFNGIFADKMLVMIDGRSIYTPIYSGTFWDQNEVLIEDVERIEVIRGPGATMWGANAVNGVINIITKKAKDTLGTQFIASEGRTERGGSLRYGGQRGTNLQYRVFLKDQKNPALLTSAGASATDAADALRGGARVDWRAGQRDWITMHGDLYRGREDQMEFRDNTTGTDIVLQDKAQISGGYGLVRWEHRADGSDFAAQAYYNDQNRKEFKGYGREGTTDIDFQHHFTVGARNDVTWGLGSRYNSDHLRGANVPFQHATHTINLFSSFLQDEFSVIPNKVVLTAGSKLQWNTYTHYEVQPGVRLLWTPDTRHSIWTSVSRSVKTPSILDRDLHAYFPLTSNLPFPMEALLLGNPSIKSEAILGYEGGYRQQIGKHVSADLAGFFYHYSKLVSQLQETPYMAPSANPVLIVPVTYSNDLKADSQGLEGAISWNPLRTLRLASSYAWIQARIQQNGVPSANVTEDLTWSTPRNTLDVRGAWDFARHWTMNASVDAVSRTPVSGNNQVVQPEQVPAYQRVDAGVSYSLGESAVVSAGVHNLQDAHHIEFNPQDNYDVPSEIPRSAFVKLLWSF
jgi:iron complex outermembrane recepter protein